MKILVVCLLALRAAVAADARSGAVRRKFETAPAKRLDRCSVENSVDQA